MRAIIRKRPAAWANRHVWVVIRPGQKRVRADSHREALKVAIGRQA